MTTKGLFCATFLTALICSGGGALASIPGGDLPEELELALALSVQSWIGEQADGSENQYGKPDKRGYFSRSFVPVDDETYRATAHIETAGEETKTTERYLLTLKKNGKGWDVVDEEIKDTYDGMHRQVAARCFPFDKFDFDREGMKLTAGKGSVCLAYYKTRVADFSVRSETMTYSYAPPDHAKNIHLNRDFHSIFGQMEQDHRKQLQFEPGGFLFDCDPDSCDQLLATHFTGLDLTPPDADLKGWDLGNEADSSWVRPLVDRWEDERKQSPFAHFRAPYRDGHRKWSVFVVREVDPFDYPGQEDGLFDSQGGLPGSGVQLVSNNWGGWEMKFNVWPRRLDDPEQLFWTIYGYYSADTMAKTDPYDLERREDQESRWHQVYSVSGDVSMGLEDPEMLEADITFGIELKQPLRELPFQIASIRRQDFTGSNKPRILRVNSVQLDGEELTWTRTSQLGGLVILPEEMPAGTKLELRMEFGTRALKKINASYTRVSRFGWMPFVRFGDFIDEFELTLRTPSEYKVLGIGHKRSERVEGDVTVTHWKSDSPVVFPSITFGRYEEDGPGKKFQAEKFDGTPIPVTVHVDTSSFGNWGIKPSALRPIAQQAVNSINLYREVSGLDYPYGELNFVNDPEGFLYGQAPSSLIYLGSGVFRGEGFLATRTNNPQRIAKFLKSVTAHEVGHQWWGSRISNANDRNYWFVESLAEYFSAVYLEVMFGEKEYEEQVDEWRRTIVDRRSKSTVQSGYSIWGGEDGFGSIQANIYNKGPYAFHMLREIFKGDGPPGPDPGQADEKFFAFLKQFSMELAEKREIVTMDIQNAAEKALGGVDPKGNAYNVDLDWFFDQWIRGIGIPEFRLVYDTRQVEDGSWLVEGTISQRVVVGSSRGNEIVEDKYYRTVVNLTVLAGGEEYKARRVVDGPETPFQLKVPSRPVEVALNKDGETLAHDTVVNKSWN